MYQSQRRAAYEAAIERLLAARLAYPCVCSRHELQAAQAATRKPSDELHYPGWCRLGPRASTRPPAIRLRIDPGPTIFIDGIQGPQHFEVAHEVGDFVIRRRDRLHAYQLAVALDDDIQRISHVVRGVDLLSSTPRQMILQRVLGLATPMYAHLPLATDANGVKLSKSKGAAAIDTRRPAQELWRALQFLRQDPPPELRLGGVRTLWEWAIQHWRVQPLHGLQRATVAEPP